MDKNQLNIMLEQIRQQPDEPPDAYQGFLAYSSMHGTERDLRLVAEKTGYHFKTVSRWSHIHRWSERAAMVDAQRWLADEENRQKLMEDDNRRFADKTRQMKEKIFTVTDQMLDLSEKLLKRVLQDGKRTVKEYVTDKDGNKVPVVIIDNVKWKVSDIRGLVDSGVKNSRLAADLPTEIVDNKNMPLPSNLKDLSDEEVQIRLQEEIRQAKLLDSNIKIDTLQ